MLKDIYFYFFIAKKNKPKNCDDQNNPSGRNRVHRSKKKNTHILGKPINFSFHTETKMNAQVAVVLLLSHRSVL
jgi:hypothetical protein